MIDITPIVLAIIGVATAVLTTVVVPWVKSSTTAKQQQELYAWVQIAVSAAEQLFQGSCKGAEKKAYVTDWLSEHGLSVDESKLDAMIESAVYELDESLKGEA